MARGTIAKEQVIEKLLETFPGAFQVDKEIRIPIEDPESGLVQIKCSVTCAAKNIDPPDGSEVIPTVVSGATAKNDVSKQFGSASAVTGKVAEPSEEELSRVDDFLKRLGIV